MEKPWKIHGEKSMNSLENHGAGAKCHGFHGGYFHAFHASMGQENCKNIPHHGKHGNLQK